MAPEASGSWLATLPLPAPQNTHCSPTEAHRPGAGTVGGKGGPSQGHSQGWASVAGAVTSSAGPIGPIPRQSKLPRGRDLPAPTPAGPCSGGQARDVLPWAPPLPEDKPLPLPHQRFVSSRSLPAGLPVVAPVGSCPWTALPHASAPAPVLGRACCVPWLSSGSPGDSTNIEARARTRDGWRAWTPAFRKASGRFQRAAGAGDGDRSPTRSPVATLHSLSFPCTPALPRPMVSTP